MNGQHSEIIHRLSALNIFPCPHHLPSLTRGTDNDLYPFATSSIAPTSRFSNSLHNPFQNFPSFKDTTVVMRFSRVLATATGLLPALSSLASAAYLPTATRSINPLLGPRDLSVEAHVCADLDTKISVFVLDIVEVDIDLHICLCVDAVVEYVNSRSDIPDDCRADASRKITNKVSFVCLSLVFSFYLFTDWSATFHCLDQKPPFCRSVSLPSQLQTYLTHMLLVKKVRLQMRTWLHQEPYHR